MTAEILAKQLLRNRGIYAPVGGDGGSTPGPGGTAPWATTVFDTLGVFHSSQGRSDFQAFETFLGRTMKFNLRFLTGGWANNTGSRPVAWDDPRPGCNTISAYKNVLDLSSDWYVNRPDVTQIVTFPAFPAGLTYITALVDAATQAFWTDLGTWVKNEGLLDLHPDGRPFFMIRGPGWENDGSWYNWGLRHTASSSSMNGGSLTLNAPYRKAYAEQCREWFETGAGTDAGKTLWVENYMAADLGTSSRDAIAANIPDSCDTISQDSYDTYDGGAYYGGGKSQDQKDAAYSTVWNKILTQRTGRRWGVQLAADTGKMWALDESGMFFDNPPGARIDAGGDHAYPAINWFQDGLDEFNLAVTGPQTLGILSHHIVYNARSSGGEGTTQFNPVQSYAPNARLAATAAY